jgi:hypothetical protein
MLTALAWWAAMGHDAPTRAQLAAVIGWKVTSGHLKNVAGALSTAGLITYPSSGRIVLTPAGARAAPEPDLSASLHERVRAILTGPQRSVFDLLVGAKASLSREDVATRCGWEPTSGHVKNVLGSLSSLELITYPARGRVQAAEWLFS